MNTKALLLALPLALTLAACGEKTQDHADASHDAAQAASDYAAYSSASDTPPPDILPDDAGASGEIHAANQHEQYEATYQGDGKTVHAAYELADGVPVVRLTENQKTIVLKQTDAWANGAAFSDGKQTWVNNGESAELEQEGKTSSFKLVSPSPAAATASSASH